MKKLDLASVAFCLLTIATVPVPADQASVPTLF
jgi:hypothetical protein